ncbi:MAG TPA: NapC/NirT family cytochrome c, partial [Anaerolineaceae bacterium]|nr:NapC/NirT family cytochrome c [Anaerolineaceae bacterium]
MKLPLIVGILALVAVLGTGLWATDFPVYLGNVSTACNNCHVMDYAYEGWYHAAHQSCACCVDCYVPHNL